MYIDLTEDEVATFKETLKDAKEWHDRKKVLSEHPPILTPVSSKPSSLLYNDGVILLAFWFFIGFIWGLIVSRHGTG